MNFNVILFDEFETLDAFGPIEIIGKLEKIYNIKLYSETGGIIKSSQNVGVDTLPISKIDKTGVLMIPGGLGTRSEVNNKKLIRKLKELSLEAKFVLTICTGSALLAKTGLLKNKKATTNKRAFDWVVKQDKEVQWIRKARWVDDDKYYTSSGVSAGMDMTLGFISNNIGKGTAERISTEIEYIWNKNKEEDPFSNQ